MNNNLTNNRIFKIFIIIQFFSIHETKMLNNVTNINNSIPDNIQISTQQSNRIVSSTHQTKVNQSNVYNQNINQVKLWYNNNFGNTCKNNNYFFPISNITGKKVAKIALAQNNFALNQKVSELPTLEEKIMNQLLKLL